MGGGQGGLWSVEVGSGQEGFSVPVCQCTCGASGTNFMRCGPPCDPGSASVSLEGARSPFAAPTTAVFAPWCCAFPHVRRVRPACPGRILVEFADLLLKTCRPIAAHAWTVSGGYAPGGEGFHKGPGAVHCCKFLHPRAAASFCGAGKPSNRNLSQGRPLFHQCGYEGGGSGRHSPAVRRGWRRTNRKPGSLIAGL
jgi:hypothetical protein